MIPPETLDDFFITLQKQIEALRTGYDIESMRHDLIIHLSIESFDLGMGPPGNPIAKHG